MSFADHIRACNNFDRARVVPLIAGGRRIGWLRRDNAVALARFDTVFAVEPERVALVASGDVDTVSAVSTARLAPAPSRGVRWVRGSLPSSAAALTLSTSPEATSATR